jgi:hypothetical protein
VFAFPFIEFFKVAIELVINVYPSVGAACPEAVLVLYKVHCPAI